MPAPAPATSRSGSAGGGAGSFTYFLCRRGALGAIGERGVKDFIANLQAIIARKAPTARKLREAIANHLAPLRARPDADYICVFLRHRHELPNGPRQMVARLARTYQDLIER